MPTLKLTGMKFCLLSLMISLLSDLAANPAGAQPRVQLGPRPYYLVEKMEEGALKSALQACANNEFTKTNPRRPNVLPGFWCRRCLQAPKIGLPNHL